MSTITIEDARNLTHQGLFNLVWERAKDRRKSFGNAGPDEEMLGCLYRGPNGLECFIGIAIPDVLYEVDMERRWSTDCVINRVMPHIDHKFARDLQFIHDLNGPEYWENMLKDFADKHGLTVP